MNLFFNLHGKRSESFGFILVSVFAVFAVWARKIELYPFNYNQEYAALVVGRLPENIGQHLLFYSDSFVPLLHYLPYSLLSNEVFVIVMVFTMAAAPWLLLLLTLRKLQFPPLAAMFAAIATFYIGLNYTLDYMQEPNPFMIFRYVNFRMIIFPIFGVFIYLCATCRWFLAGLAMGLLAASHAKFGAKVWLLSTLILVLFAVWRNALQTKLSWKDIGFVQIGFVATFSFTAWQLIHASVYLSHLRAPRASELISPFGYLRKNEPDDWLFLFNSPKQIYGAFILAAAAALLSLWLSLHGKGVALKRLAIIGLVSNGVALSAAAFEVWFEKFGMSLLPAHAMLKVFLLRPWDFLWVAPLTLGILGSLFFALQPRKPIGNWIAVAILAICGIGSIRDLIHASAPWEPLDRVEHTVSAIPNYSTLTVCSSLADEHARAKKAAIQALWNRDRVGLNSALAKMNETFRSANNGRLPKLTSDPEADNLQAIFEFRMDDYAAGYAILLLQNKVILSQAPNVQGWMGDVNWECSAEVPTGSIGFRAVVKPWKDFDEATAWIAKNTLAHSRVIHMPSLTPVIARTKRASFWETKIDSHPMYSFPGYYGIGLDRLEAIAGPNSIELTPGFRYGDPGETGRRAFLSLKREDFERINAKYGSYQYILTERQHWIDLPLVYSNDSFAVYRLD